MIVGIIWISFIFVETEKTHDTILLKQSDSFELNSKFTGIDIGFYKVYMPEFAGEEVFVQILDTKDNVIREERIQTKMSVGYFDFNEDGIHTVKVTNISKLKAFLPFSIVAFLFLTTWLLFNLVLIFGHTIQCIPVYEIFSSGCSIL